MGVFGKAWRQENREFAERQREDARKWSAEARKFKDEAEEVKRRNDPRNNRYPDPAAARAIVKQLDSHRRSCEYNARQARAMAAEADRHSRSWF